MDLIRTPYRQLAAFVVAGDNQRLRIVRKTCSPASESRTRIPYYNRAKGAIRRYHQHPRPASWLTDFASDLMRHSAGAKTPHQRANLIHNAEAVQAYRRSFGSRDFHTLPQVRMTYPIGGLSLTVGPDMHVTEEDSERFLRVEPTDCSTEEEEVMAMLIWLAANARLPDLPASACAVLDLRSGQEVRSPVPTSQMLRKIERVCSEYAAMYDLVS